MATITADVRRGSGGTALTVLLALMVLLNYVDRGALGIAAPGLKEELALDAVGFGLAVSAFSWVYAPSQFLIGWLSERICVYRLVAAGLAVWALATTLTGFVTSLTMLVAMRVILGIGEGVAFPAASAVIARHVHGSRRGMANGVVASALYYGPALGSFAGGMILASAGWRPIFLIFGLVTFLWLIPWLMSSKPHWRRPETERGARVPIGRILAEPTAWSTGIGHFCNTYGFYFLLAWLPLFLVKSRGFTVLEMTSLLTMLYLVLGTSALAVGWLSDRLVAAGYDESRLRKGLMGVSHGGTAITILGAGLSTSPEALTAWLMFYALVASPGGSNCYALAQIYAGPRAAGSWVGVMNGLGNISGIVGPILTGVLIERSGNYLTAFYVAAAIPAFGAFWWTLVLPRARQLIVDEPAPA